MRQLPQGCGRSLVAIYLAVASVPGQVAEAQSTWQNYWTAAATPMILPAFSRSVIAPDGDAVVATLSPTQADYTLVRFSPAGAARWVAHFGPGNQDLDPVTSLLVQPDGSIFVGFDTPGYGYVAKFDAAGALLWTRHLPVNAIVAAPSGTVVTAGCSLAYPQTAVIAKLDAANGNVLWDFEAPARSMDYFWCAPIGLVADQDGNAYAMTTDRIDYDLATTTLRKFDAIGDVAWALPNESGIPIGVANGTLFVLDGGVRARATDNGALRWSSTQATGIAGALVPGSADPIILGTTAVSRLNGTTGALDWSTPVDAPYPSLAVSAGSIIVASGMTLTRVSAASGDIAWSSTFSKPDLPQAYAPHIVANGVANESVQAVVAAHDLSNTPFWLQTIDLQNGAAAMPTKPADVLGGSSGGASIEDSGARFSVAVFSGAAGSEIRVRRLDAADGIPVWEASEPAAIAPLPDYPSSAFRPSALDLAADAATVVVAGSENLTDNDNYVTPGSGAAWVAAYDRSSGARRWSSLLQEPFQLFTATAPPLLMDNGDVVVAFGAAFEPYYTPPAYAQYSVLRMAAGDGHVLWRQDASVPLQALPGSYGVGAPVVSRIAADLLVATANPLAPGTTTLRRLAGSDGSPLWSSAVLGPNIVDQVHPLSDGTAMVRGSSSWARVDAQSGAVLWTRTDQADPECPPNNLCYTGGSVAEANGDLLSSGRSGTVPVVVRRRGDGSGVEDFWHLESAVDGARAAATQIALDAHGTAWVRISRVFTDAMYGVEYVGAIDQNAGTMPVQQAVGTFQGDAQMPTRTATFLDGPDDARLPAIVFDGTHGGPATPGDAAIDLGIVATGDLVAQAQTAQAHVAIGDSVAFRFSAHYDGDAPISGVKLVGFVPWSSGLFDVSCSVMPAGACAMSTASGNIAASFPLQPGGEAVIEGHVRVLGWPATPRAFEAVAIGPAGLAEPDMRNNFARSAIVESVFFNGFDQ